MSRPATVPGTQPAPPPTPPAPAPGTLISPPGTSPQSTPPAPGTAPLPGRSQTQRDAERLLWRAGFGPRPGDIEAFAAMDRQTAVWTLTRPSGAANLIGPAPHHSDGSALAPADVYWDNHLWWLDRMVRSDQPLVERMTLIWHDWFATSNDKVGHQQATLDQNALLRTHALGRFDDLLMGLTQDPAMLEWLDGIYNSVWDPNENYAREMMELFTLGADRGAYTEDDVRENARALTGFRADWDSTLGLHNFRFDATRHDATSKTIFGQTGNWSWPDSVNLVLNHPLHASFFVTKLWGYFIPTAPDSATLSTLSGIYTSSGRQIRPVVEAILMHDELYSGASMVKPPVVVCAGLLRALARGVDTEDWGWICSQAGQVLFYPPNVAGWDAAHWLDTSTMLGRWSLANYASMPHVADPGSYSSTEDSVSAVNAARSFWGNPSLSDATVGELTRFADACAAQATADWQRQEYRGLRQNALRQLIAVSPDYQTS